MILCNDILGFVGGLYYVYIGVVVEYLYFLLNLVFIILFVVVCYVFMYGVEYDLNVFGYDNGDDILCIVCYSWFVISFIMIFGMNNCVFGWRI